MQHVAETVREHRVRFPDLKYADMLGRLRHVTMPVERWIELENAGVEALARKPHPWEYNLYHGC